MNIWQWKWVRNNQLLFLFLKNLESCTQFLWHFPWSTRQGFDLIQVMFGMHKYDSDAW